MSLLSLQKTTVTPELTAALGERYNAHELRLIERLGTTVTVAAGRRFVTEGAFGREAVIIVDGEASIVRRDANGDVAEIATVTRGDMVGEVALLSGETRNADVVATTDLRVVVFNIREFGSLLEQAPRLSAEVADLAKRRARL